MIVDNNAKSLEERVLFTLEEEILSGELILRGYDSLTEKLRMLGADISYE